MEPATDPLPRLADRIVLRRLALTDLPSFQLYRRDSRVGLYQSWEPQSDQDASLFIAEMSRVPLFPLGQWVQLAIADRISDALIGDVGVHVAADGATAEIGFTLSGPAQGQGLGTEAVRSAIELVFDRAPVERIVAVTDARNLPSIRLLERVGMQRIDAVQAMFKGEPCTEYRYAISRDTAGRRRGS